MSHFTAIQPFLFLYTIFCFFLVNLLIIVQIKIYHSHDTEHALNSTNHGMEILSNSSESGGTVTR